MYCTSIEEETIAENAEFTHLASDIHEIKAGDRHLIMQKNDGSLWGWGVNKHAELGYGDYKFMYNEPVRVQEPVKV